MLQCSEYKEKKRDIQEILINKGVQGRAFFGDVHTRTKL